MPVSKKVKILSSIFLVIFFVAATIQFHENIWRSVQQSFFLTEVKISAHHAKGMELRSFISPLQVEIKKLYEYLISVDALNERHETPKTVDFEQLDIADYFQDHKIPSKPFDYFKRTSALSKKSELSWSIANRLRIDRTTTTSPTPAIIITDISQAFCKTLNSTSNLLELLGSKGLSNQYEIDVEVGSPILHKPPQISLNYPSAPNGSPDVPLPNGCFNGGDGMYYYVKFSGIPTINITDTVGEIE